MGEWSELQTIPEGEFIVGLKVNTGNEAGITGLVIITTILDDE